MTQPKVTDAMAHKIRYTYLQSRSALASKTEYSKGFSAGKTEGIAETLKLLGITIERVNA